MNASKAMDWIRLLFAQIDKVIYWLISVTYSIINRLSEISIFGSGDIQEFASRIYAFLGVIMLFKVTFSLITYLIDPDAIGDKTKGTGNLIKNIIVTLFLIIIVPYGFDLLYRAQSAIINDNLIPKLILGTKDTETTNLQINMDEDVCGTDYTVVENYGDYLATVTLRPFLKINGADKEEKEKYINALDERFSDAKADYCIKSASSKLSSAVMYADTADLNTGQYIFDYSFLVSTAFGILIFLLLLNFCFDIAVRTIKLGFLEIIAPIPIISYIDPKSGKDGIFKKWVKEVMNTWLSLFIRLAAIYFAIYLITIINTNVEAIHDENGNIIMLFLIIGALMFAKQAIPLIENIFGIKFNHTVQLNPFKKISDQALGGKQLLGIPGKTLSTGLGLGLAAGGAIAGHRLKTQKIREGKQNLSAEEKRLERLKTEMKSKIGNYKALESVYGTSSNPVDIKKLKDARNEAIQSGYAIKTSKARVENLKTTLTEAEEKYKKDNSDNQKNPYFSSEHPILSATIQALRGAKIGFDSKETANIAKAVTAGIEAAKKSAKITNNFDKFGYMDRLRDLGTDLTGVKNESGTTSIVKQEMKEQTECLNNIRNAISSLEHTFGNLKPGAISYDQNGKITINTTGTYRYSSGERESIEALINQYESLRKNEKDTAKQIKEYEEILAINKPPAK